MADSKLSTVPHRNLGFSPEQLNLFLKGGKCQSEFLPRPTSDEGSSGSPQKRSIGGKISSYKSTYLSLPRHLKICFDYCCFVINPYVRDKRQFARLLVAEGLIVQEESVIVNAEDVALSMIEELITLRMLIPHPSYQDYVRVSSSYQLLRDEEDLGIDSPIRLFILNYRTDSLCLNFGTLFITSLFVRTFNNKNERSIISAAHMRSICTLKSLVVLEFVGKIECLPDEIGELLHLKYLGLCDSNLKELPNTIGRLQNLQTSYFLHLDLHELPAQVFDIPSLRHLIMFSFKTIYVRKIWMMKNLQTLQGVYAGGGIAEELSKLTQLRQLGVKRISDDHATELSASIMKMPNLIKLSMEAETTSIEGEEGQNQKVCLFPEMDTFIPPPHIQEVTLRGQLVEMPSWLVSMKNLTKLYLLVSYLSDNPTSEIQFLPNLKHLLLDAAFKAKCITEEFCEPGGFPSLKTLEIRSKYLVEWTEIVNGAFPSLESLAFCHCNNFRFFPDGLENILTLEKLRIDPIYEDLKRLLKGAENYKIKNIPNVELRSW